MLACAQLCATLGVKFEPYGIPMLARHVKAMSDKDKKVADASGHIARLDATAAAQLVAQAQRQKQIVCAAADAHQRVASYATKNQYGLTEADRPQVLEWDRVLCSTLGVANKRLYELRTQCAAEDFEKTEATRRVVRESFVPFEVDQSNLSFPLF